MALSEGRLVRLRVATRKVPFDVDLGTDGEGRTVATYSRCRSEPSERRFTTGLPNYATASGCDLYLYDFKRRTERRLRRVSRSDASEYLPSASSGRIAFARIFERRRGVAGRLPYLYAAKLSTGRENKVPGGTRGVYQSSVADVNFPSDAGGPGPLRLDLLGRQLALSWAFVPSAPPPARYGCPEYDREFFDLPFIDEIREVSLRGGSRLVARTCELSVPNLVTDAQAAGGGRVTFLSRFIREQCYRATVTRAGADGTLQTLQPLPAEQDKSVMSFAQTGDKGFFAVEGARRTAVIAVDDLNFAKGLPGPPTEPPCP